MPGDLRPRRVFTVFAAVCLAIVVAGAQSPAQQPTFRDRVDVVRLDVAVVDKDKHPVRGLTAKDFTVLEDGVPARIVDVAPIELPGPEPVATPWLRDVASDVTRNDLATKRLIVILFDDAYTGLNHSMTSGPFRDPWIAGAGKRIAHAVVDELGPNDMAAVTFAYMGRRQNFTTDRAKLHKAIDTFVPQAAPGLAGAPLGCLFKGKAGCVLDAFDHIVTALPETPPSRKAIIFISQNGGLPAFTAEALARYDAQPETKGESSTVISDLGSLFRKLQHSNTSIYAFSPGGLQIVNNGGSDNLKMLAENTGGRAVADTNTPWKGVPAVMEETSAYYLVGVQTAHRDGRFHKVKVRVNRPGVDVRARIGYFTPAATSSGPASAGKAADVSPIDVALLSGFPTADMAMAAVVVPYARSNSAQPRVAIRTAVVPQAATAAPMPVELIATAFDKEWKPAATSRQTVTVSNAVGTYAEILSTLDLAPGRYELRIGAATPDHVGSVFVDLEIPDFAHAPFSTSGLMLLPGGGFARVEPDSPVRPSVRRTFAASERASVVWQLYQRGADKVVPATVTLTITDDQGRMVSTTDTTFDAEQFAARKAATYASWLPLNALGAGEYLVTLAAKAGSRSESANIRIRIQ